MIKNETKIFTLVKILAIMAILFKNVSPDVMAFIYDTQVQYKKQNRSISLEKTLEILIREAYLKDKNGEPKPAPDINHLNQTNG